MSGSPVARLVVRAGRLEIRFPYDPDTQEELRVAVQARWSPELRTWWAAPGDQPIVAMILEDRGYAVVFGDTPGPSVGTTLKVAVEVVLGSVSKPRRSRLAKALAVAAHPDGDAPDRPAAADELVRLANEMRLTA